MNEDDSTPNNDNVISLEKLRTQRHNRNQGAAETNPADSQPDNPASPGLEPIPGAIVWLRCPKCETLEYTEVELPGDRMHKCGTIVAEVRVELDLRAESTVTQINLERIKALTGYLEAQRQHFEEYRRRIEILAGESPEPYPTDEELSQALPIAQIDPLGLLIPKALSEPEKRFESDQKP